MQPKTLWCTGRRTTAFRPILVAATGILLPLAALHAEDLKEYGRRWDEIQSGWSAEQTRHQQAMETLKAGRQTPETQRQIDGELSRHSGRSKEFAGQRQVIQDKIVSEANRRTAGGQHETSAPGRKTAGTDPSGPRGRGMAGDADYGSGARTADKVQDVLDDMGIATPVKRTPSTIEIGDNLNMTVNKEGRLGPPGSAAHQTQIEVDARVKDTYISESMPEGQPGRDYVQVQDHKKKALGGLTSDPADLPGKPDTARDMVKGATKSLDHLPADEAEEILRRHGLTPDDMAAIKTGQANVTPENAERVQRASRDVIEAAEARTRTQADADLADSQRRIAELEASGNKADARQLREDLVDSRTKIRETTAANAEMETNKRTLPDGDAPKPTTDTPEGRPPIDTPDGPSRSAAVDTPDGPSKGPMVDTPDGPSRAAVIDTPDGPSRTPVVDTPDGGTPAGSTTGSKIRGALDVVGQGMQAVDVLSGAQDFKEAALEGDVGGMTRAAVNTVDSLTGGVKSTVDTIVTKGGDYAAAQAALDHANQQHLVSQNQRIALDLQRAGLSKEEIRQILDAKANGDEGRLRAEYERLGVPVPALEVETSLEGDDTVLDRAGQAITGAGEKIVKAGQFVDEARRDLTEIGSGLTEEHVAGELIDQQAENLSPSNLGAGLGALVDTVKAGFSEDRARDALAEKLTEKGATPEEAAAAAAAWLAGDRTLLDQLRDRLGVPVRPVGNSTPAETTKPDAGQTQLPDEPPPDAETPPEGDLQTEPASEDAGGQDEAGAEAGGATFVDSRNERAQINTQESLGLTREQQDIQNASTEGDKAELEASSIRATGDAEAQATLEAGTAQIAAEDRRTSVGNAIASGLQQAAQQGLTSIGTTFSERAAGATADAILGPETPAPRGPDGDRESTSAVDGDPTDRGPTKGDRRGDRHDRDHDREESHSAGEAASPAPPSGGPSISATSTGASEMAAITCPICGTTRYYVRGTTPPPCRSGKPPLSQQGQRIVK